MKASFRMIAILLTGLATLQVPSPASAAAPVVYEWNPGTEHPMQALMEAAPTLTPEAINLLRQARQPKLDLNALARIPAVAASAKACMEAKDEFEHKRLEGALKEEVRTAAQAFLQAPYLKVVLNAQLGNYSFQAKGFPFRGDGLAYLRNDLVQFSAPGSWPVFPTLLPVAEDLAEAWVKQHPGRRVTVVVLVPARSFRVLADRPGFPTQTEGPATFSAFFWNDGPARPQTVIAAFPSEASLSALVLAKAAETLDASREVDKARQAEMLPRIWARLAEHGRPVQEDSASDLITRATEAGFKLERDPKVAQAAAALKKATERQRAALTTLVRAGRDYQGTQFLANGTQRPIVLRLTKGNAENGWRGICTYANKRKAIVTVDVRECQHGPCLNMEFYLPTDNEIGAGEGQNFHLVGNQAFGMAMSENLIYHTEVRTRILFQ